MANYRVNIAAPNLTNICVDQIKDGEYSGKIYHKYKKEETSFQESSQLIAILEKFFDFINYPQASTKYRSFQKKKNETQKLTGKKSELPVPVQSANDILTFRGIEATFFLHVQFRQNSTWQGKLIWVEEEQEENFSSVLEFLKLLDSALIRD